MKRKIAILGSTGSIGTQTLEVASNLGYNVTAITGNRSAALLEEQARRFRPELVAVFNASAAADLRVRLADTEVKVADGPAGLAEAAAATGADTVVTAVVGTVGLKPTLAAIREGKRIALANKETLVCAGHLVMAEAARCGAEILPVDSEHSAIFQCITGKPDEIKRLILTASGGPFRGKTAAELEHVTREDALKHPNWSMGRKITIDSATLMNKGLELIEAMHLFQMPADKIDILVHPQSIVHSMVEYVDNSVLAQLGMPDMKMPIQLALTYPERLESPAPALDLAAAGPLTFQLPDLDAFPCLRLAIQAARTGCGAPAVLNAANEAAVARFLAGEIGFMDIFRGVRDALAAMNGGPDPELGEIMELDKAAREYISSWACS